jgi:hypothetical protein
MKLYERWVVTEGEIHIVGLLHEALKQVDKKN